MFVSVYTNVCVTREGGVNMFFVCPPSNSPIKATILGRRNNFNNMHIHKPNAGGMVTAIKLGK